MADEVATRLAAECPLRLSAVLHGKQYTHWRTPSGKILCLHWQMHPPCECQRTPAQMEYDQMNQREAS